VGCLRCTVQYPEVVQIHRNPAWDRLGDSPLTPEAANTILYEARTSRVPVRGAGYQGSLRGEGYGHGSCSSPVLTEKPVEKPAKEVISLHPTCVRFAEGVHTGGRIRRAQRRECRKGAYGAPIL